MRSDKKARSTAATVERAQEQRNNVRGTSVSQSKSNTRVVNAQAFLDYLPHAPERAITAAQLARFLGVSPREVTKTIQTYRLHGVPICASCGEPRGYYIADETEMLARYVRTFEGRLNELNRTCVAMRNALDNMRGQGRMEGF